MRDVRPQEIATFALDGGFGAGKKRDFMVHHLGAGFSKETFY